VLSGLHCSGRPAPRDRRGPARLRPLDPEGLLGWLDEVSPEVGHQQLHRSHDSFLDPAETRFLTADLIRGSTLSGTPEELVKRVGEPERQGLRQVML